MSIAQPPKLSRHRDAVLFLNELILDLKLEKLGEKPHAAIGMERLNIATAHLQKIQECSEPAIRY